MNVGELKETIVDQGRRVSGHAIALLSAARQTNIGIGDSVNRIKIYGLKRKYDEVQQEFRKYDAYVWSYLGMAARPIGTGARDDEERETEQPFHYNAHFMLSLYANHIFSQREDIRTTLRDTTDEIRSLEGEATNLATIGLAAISLIVALASLVISIIALSM